MSNFDKYVVQEKPDSAYRFVVAENIGTDAQASGGPWFKTIAHFTYRPFAEEAAKQLNAYGELYFPGRMEYMAERSAIEPAEEKP